MLEMVSTFSFRLFRINFNCFFFFFFFLQSLITPLSMTVNFSVKVRTELILLHSERSKLYRVLSFDRSECNRLNISKLRSLILKLGFSQLLLSKSN